jgi:hypothetical protein
MSITYNITTNFGGKDALAENDPNKTIRGSEFTTEFTAIRSAFLLAAPAASPTFTGTATFNDATVVDLTVSGDFAANGTATFGNLGGEGLTLTSTNTGAQEAPILVLDRDSASPAAFDDLGVIQFKGRDSIGSATTYAEVAGQLRDPLHTSEDGGLYFRVAETGSFVDYLRLRSGGGAEFPSLPVTAGSYTATGNGGASSPQFKTGVGSGMYGTSTTVSFATGSQHRMTINSSGEVQVVGDLDVGGEVRAGDGTVSQPSISFSDESSMGLYRPDADTLGFVTGGNERMTIDASGQVGIGTPTPSVPLDVAGTINTSSVVRGAASAAGTPTFSFSADPNTGMYRAAADELGFATGGTARVVIDNVGNVGIGDTNPFTGLHVSKDSAPSGIAQVVETDGSETFINFRGANSGSTQVRLGMATNALVAYTNSIERMRIDAAGDVGIGTSAPDGKLTVDLGAATGGELQVFTNGGHGGVVHDATLRIGRQFSQLDRTVAIKYLGTAFGNDPEMSFEVGNVERMRIDDAGHVGIGAAPVATSTYRTLNITGGADSGGALRLSTTQDESGHLFNFNSAMYLSGDGTVFISTGDPDSGAGIPLRTAYRIDRASALHRWYDPSDGSTERMRIDASGQVGIGTTSPSAALDIVGNSIRLRSSQTPVGGGNVGEIAWDDDNIYVRTSTGWKKAALTSI